MNLSIAIASNLSETKTGISQRTGKAYTIIEQQGTVDLPNGERRNISLQLEPGMTPLAPGRYEPKPEAVYCAKYGKLEISQRARDWQLAKKAA